ncbi:PIG-L family deacetylase [Alienimonas californiensis]|uniref:1D-myo-inositol 2-acetamido-2-deoxy-alpha-D-glucopyranoside deacetylase n=1 Tax=Alienimonas californiensis TaxID=2527989 RepID=A0A517P9A0_9PLAN|nr:PIG-L family deacetylase [Alienimonas californiensis]QDT15953.1 1D-myo-inositol 2-acetamido-2-deoxy-alpha-D-glucopyranoside deacetylase [Alienimonas californiensis]
MPRSDLSPADVPQLDLLVVASHPDDAEISVGGTILAHLAAGKRVGVVDLTDGEPTPHGDPATRARETAAATETLGLTWRHNLGLKNRHLTDDHAARAALAGVFRLTRPRIVLGHAPTDTHPDHVRAARLTADARFWAKLSKTDQPGQPGAESGGLPGEPFFPPKLYHFWSVHLREIPTPAFCVDITGHLERKLAAVRCYHSQVVTGRDTNFPTVIDDLETRARYWGWAMHTTHAEPLGSGESVGVKSLFDLG